MIPVLQLKMILLEPPLTFSHNMYFVNTALIGLTLPTQLDDDKLICLDSKIKDGNPSQRYKYVNQGYTNDYIQQTVSEGLTYQYLKLNGNFQNLSKFYEIEDFDINWYDTNFDPVTKKFNVSSVVDNSSTNTTLSGWKGITFRSLASQETRHIQKDSLQCNDPEIYSIYRAKVCAHILNGGGRDRIGINYKISGG